MSLSQGHADDQPAGAHTPPPSAVKTHRGCDVSGVAGAGFEPATFGDHDGHHTLTLTSISP
jgi:hypothetical protein